LMEMKSTITISDYGGIGQQRETGGAEEPVDDAVGLARRTHGGWNRDAKAMI